MNNNPQIALPSLAYDPTHWSFDGRSGREFSHAFLQYPAMMVPQMQGELIDHIRTISPNVQHVWDPFVGAGTSLGEAMLRGLDFSGNDINPLAVLVSKTKRGPLYGEALLEKSQYLFERIARDKSEKIVAKFPGLEKWFSGAARVALSRIKRGIEAEPALWARRFFWVAMAETIRLTSNSRTSTYKLHVRSESGNQKPRRDPNQVFVSTLSANVTHLISFKKRLEENGHLKSGKYCGVTDISLQCTTTLRKGFLNEKKADLLITSPPYGENRSTVPYGQYSYLPLNWIDLSDIDDSASIDYIKNTNATDAMSLGGSNRLAIERAKGLIELSPTFSTLLQSLDKTPSEIKKKVSSFYCDLNRCIDPILSRLQPGSYMVWTLGNRSVANIRVPMDSILEELIESRGGNRFAKFERVIPSKRMAGRNNISETMSRETVLIMQSPK